MTGVDVDMEYKEKTVILNDDDSEEEAVKDGREKGDEVHFLQSLGGKKQRRRRKSISDSLLQIQSPDFDFIPRDFVSVRLNNFGLI